MSSLLIPSSTGSSPHVDMELENIRRQLESLEADLIPQRPQTFTSTMKPTAYLLDVSEQELDSTTASVDVGMRLMDARYRTHFYEWVRDEKNVDATAHHLKRLVMDQDTPAVARGFRWLAEGWSMNSLSTLLIKLFYEQGLSHPRFAQLIHLLCDDAQNDQGFVVDLISTLLIGEDASMAARFLNQVASSWEDQRVVEVVHQLSLSARWTASFYEEFMNEFICHDSSMSEAEKVRSVQSVQVLFQDRVLALEKMPQDKYSRFYGLSHRQFARQVMQQLVEGRQVRRSQLEKQQQEQQMNKTASSLAHDAASGSSSLHASVSSPTSKEYEASRF